MFYNSPLCVEEFDLSDRNFRPCPCGYQVRLDTLDFRRITNIVLGLPILLQQYQEQYERSLPGLQATL